MKLISHNPPSTGPSRARANEIRRTDIVLDVFKLRLFVVDTDVPRICCRSCDARETGLVDPLSMSLFRCYAVGLEVGTLFCTSFGMKRLPKRASVTVGMGSLPPSTSEVMMMDD